MSERPSITQIIPAPPGWTTEFYWSNSDEDPPDISPVVALALMREGEWEWVEPLILDLESRQFLPACEVWLGCIGYGIFLGPHMDDLARLPLRQEAKLEASKKDSRSKKQDT